VARFWDDAAFLPCGTSSSPDCVDVDMCQIGRPGKAPLPGTIQALARGAHVGERDVPIDFRYPNPACDAPST
jgi:hypothetical protein